MECTGMEKKKKREPKPVPVILMMVMVVVTAGSLMMAHPPENLIRWLPPILAAAFYALFTYVLDRWTGTGEITGSQIAFVCSLVVYLILMAATGYYG
jgi:hypothetical protein